MSNQTITLGTADRIAKALGTDVITLAQGGTVELNL